MMRLFPIMGIVMALAVLPAFAAPGRPGAPAPMRYVSLRSDKAYLREGPSFQHRVLWVYKHKGYPFQVIAEYDIWRRLKGPDGTVGWMSAAMLTDQRSVLVTGKARAPLYADPEPRAKLVAWAMPGATAKLEACALRSCRISAPGLKGWIDKDRIWGVGKDEVFK